MKRLLFLFSILIALHAGARNPVYDLVDRIDPGASSRFVFIQTDCDGDFFEISSDGSKPVITGNNPVNIAAGLNWYLKYYAGVHVAWNSMHQSLPEALPLPSAPERHDTYAPWRYYLNYCTHSYSMAFWDWERWQEEIDWMALHGINLPLAMTGMDVVWRKTLLDLGWSKEEADDFVAGPAFQAWWLMNNLEGWGGPVSEEWYQNRETLQKQILKRMHEFGMHPVLPGYSGMLPHDADTKLGIRVSGKGNWNGFTRPVFIPADDPKFDSIADTYYKNLTALYGKADFYSMDPFHEGGSLAEIDLRGAGASISEAMCRANPDAIWVVQGWRENPRPELLAGVPAGKLLVLDLASEIRPMWGDPESPAPTAAEKRPDGYNPHNWLFCMLLNFGGNVGLHGRMTYIIDEYYKAKNSSFNNTLKGFGLTMEGIENNPVMYELVSELIWRPDKFNRDAWLKDYVTARYGKYDENAYQAWVKLAESIYNCPPGNLQQGTSESIFCARPAADAWQVSSWSRMKKYYEPQDVIDAAAIFIKAADNLKENPNYQYDIVDITRQAIAEKGRLTHQDMRISLDNKDKDSFVKYSTRFMNLIDIQDSLLRAIPSFTLDKWISDARSLAPTDNDKDMMERNARLLITTWGPRLSSEDEGLRDYSHREWAGILKQLYSKRWKLWIQNQIAKFENPDIKNIDFYDVDAQWVNERLSEPQEKSTTVDSDPVSSAINSFNKILDR